jgi:hypothetical protein
MVKRFSKIAAVTNRPKNRTGTIFAKTLDRRSIPR